MASNHFPRRTKTKGRLEKCLAKPKSRRKIMEITHARRGQLTKWESPIMNYITSRRSQPPLAFAVPLSRFMSQVGGGSIR
jgi:hypothetical protein